MKLQYEGSYPSVRLYKHSFSGFLATRPMSAGMAALGDRALPVPAREICFVHSSMVAHALKTPILYQKSGLLTEISRRDLSAAGLSGLSLPDAPCEHTTIRATAANLTRSGKLSTTPCQFAENRASKQWKTGHLLCNVWRIHFGKDFRRLLLQFSGEALAYLVEVVAGNSV